MRYFISCFITIVLSSNTFCQPILKPAITKAERPANDEPIGSPKAGIDIQNVSFNDLGYKVGDTIPDFTLYSVDGQPVHIKSVLQNNQLVLLVSGSYTCPTSRRNIQALNELTSFYAGRVTVYMIYVVEAHPDSGLFAYNSGDEAEEQEVKYPQPATYGRRVQIADSMKTRMGVKPEILIDGTGNEWWRHFGPAPNNAYLISPKGIILAKNGWFNDSYSKSMWCNIDKQLGTRSGRCAVQHK